MALADFARAVFALVFTLGLIGLVAVAARRFGPEWMVRLQRPRAQRRMAIVESLPLDPTRRLVLVSLDGVERLLLLGEGRWLADASKSARTPALPPESTLIRHPMIRHLASLLHRPTGAELKRAALISLITTVVSLIIPAVALAQAVNIDLGTGAGLTDRVVQLVGLITVLSLAPSIVIMTTSFVRIIVVLSLLRQALGLQQTPPNAVLISLSLFLTAIVMGPTLQTSYDQGVKPLLDHKMELPAAFGAAAQPVKGFMLSQVDQGDLALFLRLSNTARPARALDTPLQVVTPAFMISELKRAFEIGFLLFVPFLVIDLVVASVLMSMGMMMLPPVVVSLPFKLIFFVLVDGWRLVCGSLVESFRHATGTG